MEHEVPFSTARGSKFDASDPSRDQPAAADGCQRRRQRQLLLDLSDSLIRRRQRRHDPGGGGRSCTDRLNPRPPGWLTVLFLFLLASPLPRVQAMYGLVPPNGYGLGFSGLQQYGRYPYGTQGFPLIPGAGFSASDSSLGLFSGNNAPASVLSPPSWIQNSWAPGVHQGSALGGLMQGINGLAATGFGSSAFMTAPSQASGLGFGFPFGPLPSFGSSSFAPSPFSLSPAFSYGAATPLSSTPFRLSSLSPSPLSSALSSDSATLLAGATASLRSSTGRLSSTSNLKENLKKRLDREPMTDQRMEELIFSFADRDTSRVVALTSQVLAFVAGILYVVSGGLAVASSSLSLAIAGPNFLIGIAQLELSTLAFLQTVMQGAQSNFEQRQAQRQQDLADLQARIQGLTSTIGSNLSGARAQLQASLSDAVQQYKAAREEYRADVEAAAHDAVEQGNGSILGLLHNTEALGKLIGTLATDTAGLRQASINRNVAVRMALKNCLVRLLLGDTQAAGMEPGSNETLGLMTDGGLRLGDGTQVYDNGTVIYPPGVAPVLPTGGLVASPYGVGFGSLGAVDFGAVQVGGVPAGQTYAVSNPSAPGFFNYYQGGTIPSSTVAGQVLLPQPGLPAAAAVAPLGGGVPLVPSPVSGVASVFGSSSVSGSTSGAQIVPTPEGVEPSGAGAKSVVPGAPSAFLAPLSETLPGGLPVTTTVDDGVITGVGPGGNSGSLPFSAATPITIVQTVAPPTPVLPNATTDVSAPAESNATPNLETVGGNSRGFGDRLGRIPRRYSRGSVRSKLYSRNAVGSQARRLRQEARDLLQTMLGLNPNAVYNYRSGFQGGQLSDVMRSVMNMNSGAASGGGGIRELLMRQSNGGSSPSPPDGSSTSPPAASSPSLPAGEGETSSFPTDNRAPVTPNGGDSTQTLVHEEDHEEDEEDLLQNLFAPYRPDLLSGHVESSEAETTGTASGNGMDTSGLGRPGAIILEGFRSEANRSSPQIWTGVLHGSSRDLDANVHSGTGPDVSSGIDIDATADAVASALVETLSKLGTATGQGTKTTVLDPDPNDSGNRLPLVTSQDSASANSVKLIKDAGEGLPAPLSTRLTPSPSSPFIHEGNNNNSNNNDTVSTSSSLGAARDGLPSETEASRLQSRGLLESETVFEASQDAPKDNVAAVSVPVSVSETVGVSLSASDVKDNEDRVTDSANRNDGSANGRADGDDYGDYDDDRTEDLADTQFLDRINVQVMQSFAQLINTDGGLLDMIRIQLENVRQAKRIYEVARSTRFARSVRGD